MPWAQKTNFTMNNITFRNITNNNWYNIILYTFSSANLIINKLALYDSSTQSSSIFVFANHPVFIMNNFIASNNTRNTKIS